MTGPQDRPSDAQQRGGLRVARLLSRAEREQQPLLSFGELKRQQHDLQEQMLTLVAFEPHLVEQMNHLLDQMHTVNSGFTRAVRADVNAKWERRMEERETQAWQRGRREALDGWVHTRHPDEAIDHAAGHLVRLVLGWSGDSGKSARRAVQALANLEGAWAAWAAVHGLPVATPDTGPDLDEPEPQEGGERA